MISGNNVKESSYSSKNVESDVWRQRPGGVYDYASPILFIKMKLILAKGRELW